ncbi:MAG: hypothetical protein AABX11_02725 [Nanoarchaeota archaeon]
MSKRLTKIVYLKIIDEPEVSKIEGDKRGYSDGKGLENQVVKGNICKHIEILPYVHGFCPFCDLRVE